MRSFCAPCVCAFGMCVRAVFRTAIFFFYSFEKKKEKKHSELKADYSLHLAVIISAAELFSPPNPTYSVGGNYKWGCTHLNLSAAEVPVCLPQSYFLLGPKNFLRHSGVCVMPQTLFSFKEWLDSARLGARLLPAVPAQGNLRGRSENHSS